MKQNHASGTKNLTPLYCLHQAMYFFAIAGIGAFSVPYLMDKGFAASRIGVMLALTNVASCTMQPLIGSYVDRRTKALLPGIILLCLTIAFVSLGAIELFALPVPAVAVLFVLGSIAFTMTIPLSNSMCAYFAQSGWSINYSMGSGVGSLTFSLASLAYGFIIAQRGPGTMMLVCLVFVAVQMLLMPRYPGIRAGRQAEGIRQESGESLSIPVFCLRYRRLMLTLLGVMCIAACHSMAENYLIQVFNRMGGGSEHVGVALFVACITAAPFMLFFERIKKKTGIVRLMRLAGLFYVIKALLLIWAPTISSVYLVALMQTLTYGFLYPPMYYLVMSRVSPADMAKGQTIAASLFTLGSALGNSAGGAVIDYVSLNAMLLLAAAMAAAGMLLINLTIGGESPDENMSDGRRA